MQKPIRNIWRIVAIVLGIAFVAILLFFVTHQNQTFQGVKNEHPYLDPLQGFYSNTDLLVNLRPLREQLQTMASGTPITIYFESLNTGANFSVNGNLAFFPGSLMKIPVAMAVMKNIEDGQWSLSNELILTDADKNPNWGDMYQLPSGTRFTIEDLLVRLLVNSDDTARAIFIRNLGPEKINDVLQYLGMQDIFDQNLQISAQRYSNFFRALYKASYLSADSSEKLLQIMDMPHDEKLLRQGIPTNVDFSHKIGVYGDAHSDSGVVYVPNRPYILTVMVKSNDQAYVDAIMEKISETVFDYVTTGTL